MHVREFRPFPTRTAAGLALLAILCAAANLTKPVHIDDAAYLATANWVAGHPLQPMSGLFNWGDSAQPMSALNQPLLFTYLQALVQAWFGPSVLAQHALMAVMSAAVVFVFYQLARCAGSEHAVRDTALLVLGPAFLPGQNLMMDVPWVLVIPLAALAGWSLFNLFDYGGIHVLTRSVGAVTPGHYLAKAASWVAGLGAVARSR